MHSEKQSQYVGPDLTNAQVLVDKPIIIDSLAADATPSGSSPDLGDSLAFRSAMAWLTGVDGRASRARQANARRKPRPGARVRIPTSGSSGK